MSGLKSGLKSGLARCLPAEWSPQSGILLTWPHPHGDWAPWLAQVEVLYLQLARLITQYEKLLIVCYDHAHQSHIKKLLNQANIDQQKLIFSIAPSNDSWARDHGPVAILVDNTPQLMDFGFNGWGNKYPAERDDQISLRLYTQKVFAQLDMVSSGFILEGGSIDSDGKGTLLTTEHCLLSAARNPTMTKPDIEQFLKQQLGVSRVFWLSEGELAGDDTDSHIDMLARFCDPHSIAYTSCDDPDDVHYQPLAKMRTELEKLRDIAGVPYKLIPLPIPDAIYNSAGERLPASYANFLIINQAVLLPVYGDKEKDELARQRLQACFPERVVHPVNCRVLIEQFGSLHCITMQLPKGVLPD